MSILWLDYESLSECDLPKHGASNYCQDATTKMLCAAYAFDDEDVQLWWASEPVPSRLAEYFAGNGQIRCHNSEFDMQLSWYVVCPDYGLTAPKLERWYCTAAEARANCAPGSLEDAGRFAGAGMQKDFRGKQLIKMCCIPPFNTDPVVLNELGEYAKQDVRAMRSISKMMRPLSDQELADFHINCKINLLGVKIDVPLARAAIKYSAQEIVDVQALVREITNGEILSVRSTKMRQWVQDRVGPEALKLMWTGEKYSVDKNVRANLLAMADENPDEVPADVADVLQCASDIWSSSVAKFERMSELADFEDQRVRGAFVFNGGSATGRASSYGLQVHNLGRKTAKDPEAVRAEIVAGKPLANVSATLKSMIRPAIIPEKGNVFCVLDWSAIEGRVNPWLAATEEGDAKLDIFRKGLDPYIVNAAATFGRSYADILADHEAGKSDQRQQGKVQELALGFLGGVGAFDVFAKACGLRMPLDEKQRAVNGWRSANPWAMAHGKALERAYMAAMRNKGHEIRVGRIAYLFSGGHLWYVLPSGRVLCYPHARFDEEGNITYAKAAWKPKADAKEWPRARLWCGLAMENCTQATANDLLRAALRQIDNVVLHCHDEIVVECKESEAEATMAEMRRIMVAPPSWCPDLPLAVEGKILRRYGKA